MKTLLKHISLLIISGLILPAFNFHYNPQKATKLPIKTNAQATQIHPVKVVSNSYFIYEDLAAALFPLLKR